MLIKANIQLGCSESTRPVCNPGIEFVTVLSAHLMRAVSRIVRKLRLLHRITQPLKHCVQIRCDYHPFFILGWKNIRR